MANATSHVLLNHVRALAGRDHTGQQSDGDCLRRFTDCRDETAFASLVRRHGPMVLGVCRRVLHSDQVAEDVFQATFLVLARKAGSIRKRDSIASWLHGVAHRLSLKAKADAIRRKTHERGAGARTPEHAPALPADPATEASWREFCALLDDELSRLAECYRAALVLCYLESQTRDEAARQLGWSLRTLERRLAQGRKLLRARLLRRGVTLSAALFAAALGQPATAAIPALLAVTTVRGAMQGPDGISAKVARLAEEGLKATVATKTKAGVALVLLALAVSAFGYQLTAVGELADETPRPAAKSTSEKQQAKTDRYGDPLPEGALLRLGTVRQRHAGNTTCAVFTRDSKTVIVGDMGGHVVFWDVATGKEVRHLPPNPPGGVYSVALSADGRLLATGSWGKVHLWNASTGAAVAEWTVAKDDFVRQIAFAPDGKTVALRYEKQGKSIELWDVDSGQKLHSLEGHTGNVFTFVFAPNGKTLASGGWRDPNVRIWDVATGKQMRAFAVVDESRAAPDPHGEDRPTPGDVLGVTFTSDGKTLATSGNGSRIRFWNPESGERLRESGAQQYGTGLKALHYLPDGKSLASIGGLKVRTWDAETGKMLHESEGLYAGEHLSVSPDGKVLATSGGGPNTIDLWDATTLRPLHSFMGHRECVTALAFAANGRTLFSASDTNPGNPIYEWDLTAGKPLRELGKPPSGGASSLVLSPDRRFLFTCGFDIHQFDLATGKEVRAFKGHTSYIESVSLSSDGQTLASVCRSDHTLRLWDVVTGKEQLKIELNEDWPCAAVLSPDGRTVVSGGFRDGTLRPWDTTTGKVLREIATPHQPVYTVAFSPDGKVIAAAGMGRSFTLHDAATSKLLREIGGLTSSWIVRVAFSPDGRTLAVGRNDNDVTLWEIATAGRRVNFTGHTGPVHALAFSSDGRRLASGGDDTTILGWDVAGPPLAKPLSEKEVDDLWADLSGEDAAKAHRAIWTLAAAPRQALPLFQQHLKPAAAPTADVREQFTQLLADLDSDEFVTRQKTDAKLKKLEPAVEPLARQALQGNLSVEVRRRVERLLSRIEKEEEAGWIRTVRVLESVEHIATPEARQMLHILASGAADARLTREANAALARIEGHRTR
jgi:RNA polymerase sigma factor (sigma-70 family)